MVYIIRLIFSNSKRNSYYHRPQPSCRKETSTKSKFALYFLKPKGCHITSCLEFRSKSWAMRWEWLEYDQRPGIIIFKHEWQASFTRSSSPWNCFSGTSYLTQPDIAPSDYYMLLRSASIYRGYRKIAGFVDIFHGRRLFSSGNLTFFISTTNHHCNNAMTKTINCILYARGKTNTVIK